MELVGYVFLKTAFAQLLFVFLPQTLKQCCLRSKYAVGKFFASQNIIQIQSLVLGSLLLLLKKLIGLTQLIEI